MCRLLSSFAALLVLGAIPAFAQEEPFESVVTQQALHKTEGGALVLEARQPVRVLATRMVAPTYKVLVDVGGRKVPELRTEEVPETIVQFKLRVTTQTIDPGEVQAYDVDGKKLALADVAAKLTAPRPVLVSSTGEMPPAYLLSIYKPGTLVLVPSRMPREQMPAPARTSPAAGEAPDDTPPAAPREPRPKAVDNEKPDDNRADGFHGGIELATPEAFPPRLVFASQEANGEFKLREIFESKDTTTAQRIENAGGKTRLIPVAVRIATFASETRTYPPKSLTFLSLDGKEAPAAAGQLKKERLVLESADGRPLDPFFTRLIKPGTPVVVAPALPGTPGWKVPEAGPAPPDAGPAAPPPAPGS